MTRAWSVWRITWLSLMAVAAASVGILALTSRTNARDALLVGLRDHVTAQAGLLAVTLGDVPVDAIATVGGSRSLASLDHRLAALRDGGGLSDVALCGPDGEVLGSGGDWLPARAEADLILAAQQGTPTTGPLYTAADDGLYMTAYRALDAHPGWVVAVEGSGATLGAADDLFRSQLWAGLAIVVITGLSATLVATALSAPLVRLHRQLREVSPGASPDRVTATGPLEVRHMAHTVAHLLSEILERDRAIDAAHAARIQQLTRLAAGVAHEVRNPLNAMALSVQRLARTADDPVARRLLEEVRQIEVIVARLVDVTAPLKPKLHPVNLTSAVAEITTPLRLEQSGTGVALADSGMVRQVLRNLFLNAEQAGATSVMVDIGPDTGGIVLTVRDDGPGIPADAQEELFAWFHTTRAKGTGLGLPQSRRLVEAMHGTLDLTAAKPATFRLWMPSP